nr:helix-turn-helix transcriptional regulator [Lachnospiraceae bacterium]
KNEMDISPSDYLATVRMDKAKELLRTTDLKIRDISLEVGYEDDHVFTRRFKKYTGKTPGQYRSEHYVY